MKYIVLIMLLISSPAFAQFGFGVSPEVNKPKSMMVSGNSVIDKQDGGSNQEDASPENTQTDRTQSVRDDAHNMMKADKTAPPQQDIDPFSPAPQVQTPKNTKRVLKKIPAAKVERSIADDRIDDGYVQRLIKKNLTFTDPIE